MTTTFNNPVIPGFNPDPSVVRVGDDYFLVTSSFEYFPGLPIYHSKDLLNWALIGHGLTRSSQLNMRTVEPSAGIWAPTIRFYDGKFYMATAKFDRYRPKADERVFPRGFYICTNNIWDDSSWSDPVYFDNLGFDQDLFWDDDGKVYLSTTMRMENRSRGSKLKDLAVHISEIDLASGRTLTSPKVIRTSPYGIAEGSHIIKRNQYYYLFTAEGGTESGHQEWVMRSDRGPLGPWKLGPQNPLWYNATDEEVQNTGHADVFMDANGDWWAVFLGVRPRLVEGKWIESQLGRETYLVKVDWDDDWPVFNNGHNITIRTEGRHGHQLDHNPAWQANLNQGTLELGWYYKHTPLKQEWSLSARPGHLRIHGGSYDLSSPESPTMLLRKQTDFNQNFQVTLDFQPSHPGYEAGIVVWYNMYSYASIGIQVASQEAGEMVKSVVVKHPCSEKWVIREIVLGACPKDPITLSIHCDSRVYSLSYRNPETEERFESKVKAEMLIRSPPVGGTFTGVMLGLYAFGKAGPCLMPADFSNISCWS